MKNLKTEKTDVVSVILEDRDLLSTFAEALEVQLAPVQNEDDFSLSIGFLQKMKCKMWAWLKTFLKDLAQKTQILAILAEYHSNHETKKVQAILTKEKDV